MADASSEEGMSWVPLRADTPRVENDSMACSDLEPTSEEDQSWMAKSSDAGVSSDDLSWQNPKNSFAGTWYWNPEEASSWPARYQHQ
jgi:hypothetical protein